MRRRNFRTTSRTSKVIINQNYMNNQPRVAIGNRISKLMKQNAINNQPRVVLEKLRQPLINVESPLPVSIPCSLIEDIKKALDNSDECPIEVTVTPKVLSKLGLVRSKAATGHLINLSDDSNIVGLSFQENDTESTLTCSTCDDDCSPQYYSTTPINQSIPVHKPENPKIIFRNPQEICTPMQEKVQFNYCSPLAYPLMESDTILEQHFQQGTPQQLAAGDQLPGFIPLSNNPSEIVQHWLELCGERVNIRPLENNLEKEKVKRRLIFRNMEEANESATAENRETDGIDSVLAANKNPEDLNANSEIDEDRDDSIADPNYAPDTDSSNEQDSYYSGEANCDMGHIERDNDEDEESEPIAAPIIHVSYDTDELEIGQISETDRNIEPISNNNCRTADVSDNSYNKKTSVNRDRTTSLTQMEKHNSKSVLPPHLHQYLKFLPKYNIPAFETPLEETVLSASEGRNTLRYFCPYCHKNVAQLPRHVESAHLDQTLIRMVVALPKRNSERSAILEAIRLWGTNMYNDVRMFNKGILKVSRRSAGPPKAANKYLKCNNCSRLIMKQRFSSHYKKCRKDIKQLNSRHYLVSCAALRLNIHKDANIIVRERVFPVFNNDECVDIAKYDKAIIAYANYLTTKYATSTHHDKMIRSHIRILGRIVLTGRSILSEAADICSVVVTDFSSILCPPCVNLLQAIIYRLGEYNPNNGVYKHPATAGMVVQVTKNAAQVWISECIKNENPGDQQRVEQFLKLLCTTIQPITNKIIGENRTAMQRKKEINLPSRNELSEFVTFLEIKYLQMTSTLKTSFAVETWKNLGCYLLVYIIAYNKRRPGEVERMFIDNYERMSKLDKSSNEYENLTEEEKKLANRYALFIIRGKLNRTVNLLLDSSAKSSLDFFISLRGRAGVPTSNPYVFGLPGPENSQKYNYVDACRYMRIFAKESQVSCPENLRCTKIRKSFATFAASENLPENAVTDVAEHMGHAEAIHKNIYRQATYHRSVLGVAAALEKSIGRNLTITDNSTENISSFEETVDQQEEQQETLNETYRKRQSSYTQGGPQRKRWCAAEKAIVRKHFAKHLNNKTLPRKIECEDLMLNYPVLQSRTVAQIRSWIQYNSKK